MKSVQEEALVSDREKKEKQTLRESDKTREREVTWHLIFNLSPSLLFLE